MVAYDMNDEPLEAFIGNEKVASATHHEKWHIVFSRPTERIMNFLIGFNLNEVLRRPTCLKGGEVGKRLSFLNIQHIDK